MMIMSRTPFRISFFGGGTDYPEHFRREGQRGAVVGMAINKYLYISALRISGIQNYRYRVSYSRLEKVSHSAEIEHDVVRECLRHYRIDEPLDINIMSDIPPHTGLGSSSSFTVALLNLLSRLRNEEIAKMELAKRAIFVERDLLNERVGVQDQLHAAFGGINRFDFHRKDIRITPVSMSGAVQQHFVESLMLIYSGVTRHASATLDEQIGNTQAGKVDRQMEALLDLVDRSAAVMEMEDPQTMVAEFGRMMDEGWRVKRSLSSKITLPHIDELYGRAMANGALGGKLCGAGGGGFLLMVVPPERRERVAAAVSPAKVIDIGLDTQGAVLLYS